MNRTHNIRFGSLEAQVAAAAARSGLTLSDYVRQAVSQALQSTNTPVVSASTDARSALSPGERRRCILRVSAAELDRWKREAREHELALTRYIEVQMSVTPEQNHRIAATIDVVRRATVELAAVGRNLNQLARSWNTFPGQSTARERALLMQRCAEVDRLSAQLSKLAAQLSEARGMRRRPK